MIWSRAAWAMIVLTLTPTTPLLAGEAKPPDAELCFDDSEVCAGLRERADGAHGDDRPAGGASGELRYVITYRRPESSDDGLYTLPCPEDTEPYWQLQLDTETGELTWLQQVCLGEGDEGEPPAAPTSQRVWDSVPLPDFDLTLNPDHEGLTGLDTWLWDPSDHQVDLTVTLNGFALAVTARAVAWCWIMDDARTDLPPGAPGPEFCPTASSPGTYLRDHPGSEANPAATHLYETRGDYRLTLEVLWAGEYTWLGETVDLGTVVRRATRDYRVIEVRAIPTR